MRGEVTRRGFIRSTVGCVGAVSFVAVPPSLSADSAAASVTQVGYRFLSPPEAAFTESMVNVLCPADALTPDGSTVGLSRAIDLLVAGDQDAARGRGALYRHGVAAADEASVRRYGVPCFQLGRAAAVQFFGDIARGENLGAFPFAAWYSDVVMPLVTKACFMDPIYARYDNRVFWKVFA